MKRYHSVSTIMKYLGLTKEQSTELRKAMKKDTALELYNTMANGCGIENIGLPDGCFSSCQKPDVDIEYVNKGDTYATTLLKVNGNYRIGCWGDEVERYERKHRS